MGWGDSRILVHSIGKGECQFGRAMLDLLVYRGRTGAYRRGHFSRTFTHCKKGKRV